MRNAFVNALTDAADRDDRIYLITADLGWSVVERFAERHPDRFVNVGVAEQNMIGIATGLAQTGYVPFCYSIATFVAMRGYEQIRDGPVLHRLPVRLIGIGGGFAYGHAGPTHFALEDIAILRTQPGMTVLAPADPDQACRALRASLDLPGPVYLRIGKGGNPPVPNLDGRFAFDRPECVREGEDLLYVCAGDIVHNALQAAEQVKTHGVSAAVAVLAHLGWSAGTELVDLLARFTHVVTVEEGYVAGGLGSLVSQAISQHGLPCRLHACGVEDTFDGRSGSRGCAHSHRAA